MTRDKDRWQASYYGLAKRGNDQYTIIARYHKDWDRMIDVQLNTEEAIDLHTSLSSYLNDRTK